MTIDEFKKNIAPYMRKSWVAMDSNEVYYYYKYKPNLNNYMWISIDKNYDIFSSYFNIEPVKDWAKSLIKVGE